MDAMQTSGSDLVSFDGLRDFIARTLQQVGLRPADAEKVAGLMAQADLQGSDGHGVIRVPQYVKRIRAGGINVAPNIRVVQERAAMAVVDGDNGSRSSCPRARPPPSWIDSAAKSARRSRRRTFERRSSHRG
jgi:LDH2 family malate/lactate/ureidoglycolate dehydrogenase